MKKKTLLQILSLTFISVLVMFIFGIVAVNVNAKAMMKERLAEETELACSLVQTEEDFSGFARYSNDDAFRVTIMDLDGNVLFESDTKSPLENHIDREEVKNALNGKPETVERYSETFGCNMTYYALWEKEWVTAPDLVNGPEKLTLFLGDHTLQNFSGSGSVTYRYDPSDPARFAGNCTFRMSPMAKQHRPNWRSDVISFISEPSR